MSIKKLREILDSEDLSTESRDFLLSHIQKYELQKKTLDLGYQEMQKMLELIEQRELQTKSIFDSSQDMILTLDQSGQIIEFNRASEALHKVNSQTVMGKKLSFVINPCPFVDNLLQLFSEKPSPEIEAKLGQTYESLLIDNKGKELIVLISINRIKIHDKIIYPLYIKDLSRERAAAQALEESRAMMVLTSKMSALGEMAGGIAHEINTPLAIIQMRSDQLLECIQDGTLDQETLLSALGAIDNTVKRISKIISGLRSFARDGRKDPMVIYSLSKIVEDTFDLCKEKFSSHGIQLEYILKKDIQIECRPSEITQVILNILNNAFDAIQEQKDKWVRLEVEEANDFILLRVKDSGSGISLDIQQKMMQPFFSTKEIGKGAGLGLSISTGLIESHGGEIRIDNTTHNTCFAISLPLRQKRLIAS